MSTVSIRLSDSLLEEADERARMLRIPRAEYIRRAIEAMNGQVIARERRARLQKASKRVREQTMRVNAEFSALERDPEA